MSEPMYRIQGIPQEPGPLPDILTELVPLSSSKWQQESGSPPGTRFRVFAGPR